jgi:ArsR family transcriptional regulator, arsenate/arsenite/antimonite-responsive transcriptional repressor
MLTDKIFDETKLHDVAFYANAISNPMRLMIIRKIATENECITSDLQIDLPIKRTTVLQHLNELKKAGILRGNVKGKKLYYCLDYEKLNEIRNLLNDVLSLPEPQFVCLPELISADSLLPRETGQTHQD